VVSAAPSRPFLCGLYDLNAISLPRGVELSRYGFFFRNRFTDIRHSKILSWWVCFMLLNEPLREKYFPH